MSVSVWEQVIHRENEELRHLEDEAKDGKERVEVWSQDEDQKDWENEEDAFQGRFTLSKTPSIL